MSRRGRKPLGAEHVTQLAGSETARARLHLIVRALAGELSVRGVGDRRVAVPSAAPGGAAGSVGSLGASSDRAAAAAARAGRGADRGSGTGTSRMQVGTTSLSHSLGVGRGAAEPRAA